MDRPPRSQREPTAYIVGVREFWGLDFAVTPAVLIPRPETELIVEEAHRRAGRAMRRRRAIADIGTGSGCIAVAMASRVAAGAGRRDRRLRRRAGVARANAVRHGVADRIEFVATSYLDGVEGPSTSSRRTRPTSRTATSAALSPDVRHEPDVALFGGAEGLRDIAGVLETAVRSAGARRVARHGVRLRAGT